MAIGPSADGLFYLLDDTNNIFNLTTGFLAPYPGGLIAFGGNDIVRGTTDAEVINGNRGEDTITGGGGNDTLYGGKENDVLQGDQGDDFLSGNLGQDFVVGGDGNDLIRGGKGEDLLVGGNGSDTLVGDLEVDALVGNAGSDLFVLRTDTATADSLGADIILDFNRAAGDRIALTDNLTEANLSFQVFNQSIQTAIGAAGLNLSPEQARLTLFVLTGVDIDPNGDGIVTGTQIQVASTGAFLGYAVNVAPSDLTGAFTNIIL